MTTYLGYLSPWILWKWAIPIIWTITTIGWWLKFYLLWRKFERRFESLLGDAKHDADKDAGEKPGRQRPLEGD